ncbi:MAG: tRNA guanosine(15) transglycosylase TgtA [Candidatus Hydrothermarchaeota archaeon]
MFEVFYKDGLGRIGEIKTPHGGINTPTLIPVVHPDIKFIPPKETRNFGAQTIFTNAYIIYNNENLREKAIKEGIHKLMDFEGPIFTDSGSYQLYEYDELEINSLEIFEFQQKIGSDVSVFLDIPTPPFSSKKNAEKDLEETLRRAKESIELKKRYNGNFIMATVQGSTFLDLRNFCSQELGKLEFDMYAIGGVVPLMENYEFSELFKIIMACKKGLPIEKPVHLFGCGHPMIFPFAVLLGCDTFDSASYAIYARDDRLMFANGTFRLKDLEESPCICPVCLEYPLKEIKKLEKRDKELLIAKHNLYVSFLELKRVKQAIKNGSLWELVEERCRVHPKLLEALRIIREEIEFIERYDPVVKNRAFFFTGTESCYRPEVYRFYKRLFTRYKPSSNKLLMVFNEKNEKIARNYWREYNVVFIRPPFLVPIEIEDVYPLMQSVLPSVLDKETIEFTLGKIKEYLKFNFDEIYQIGDFVDYGRFEPDYGFNEKNEEFSSIKIEKLIDFQFGSGIGKFFSKFDFRKGRKGRIKYLIDGEDVVATLRTDGTFSLSFLGAKILHDSLEFPKYRVVISEEAEKFVKEGKSAFSKFVVDADMNIRPQEEVLVVNKNDSLLGVGRSILSSEEMMRFKRGVAVKVRHGSDNIHGS